MAINLLHYYFYPRKIPFFRSRFLYHIIWTGYFPSFSKLFFFSFGVVIILPKVNNYFLHGIFYLLKAGILFLFLSSWNFFHNPAHSWDFSFKGFIFRDYIFKL